jgi:hypothetical protein
MIYLIVDESKNFCKIGYTDNLESRLMSIQVGNPLKLFVLNCIEGDEEDEKKIHDMFIHLHKRGEWFLFMPEILEFFQTFTQEKIQAYYTEYKSARIKKNKFKDEDLLTKINFPCNASALDNQIATITKMSIPTARNIKRRLQEEGKIKATKEGKNEIFSRILN